MTKKRAQDILEILYPDISETEIRKYLDTIIIGRKKKLNTFNQKDCILITYPNHITKQKKYSLQTLKEFITKIPINSTHILPIHPSSSDKGFAITDYTTIKKKYGNWKHLESLSENKNLMIDFVANHTSSKHPWFKEFLKGNNKSYIAYDTKPNTKRVFRPRTTPLFTKFANKYVWTTFSPDQVDLNYRDFETLKKMIAVMQQYITTGAKIIRIDAAAYLFKNPKTKSINLPHTHLLIELFTIVAQHQGVRIITETNLPQKENISYFKDHVSEVYNFTLAPLILYTILKEDATTMAKWIRTLPTDKTCLNFTASHDGIGLTPLQGILPEKEIKWFVAQIKKKGGKISYRTKNGKKIAYEANITLPSLLEKKFLASQAITLYLKGIPAIYMGSLLSARNNAYAKANRDINREKFTLEKATKMLQSNESQALLNLLKQRSENRNFSPSASQKVQASEKQLNIYRHTTKVTIELDSGDIKIE